MLTQKEKSHEEKYHYYVITIVKGVFYMIKHGFTSSCRLQ